MHASVIERLKVMHSYTRVLVRTSSVYRQQSAVCCELVSVWPWLYYLVKDVCLCLVFWHECHAPSCMAMHVHIAVVLMHMHAAARGSEHTSGTSTREIGGDQEGP